MKKLLLILFSLLFPAFNTVAQSDTGYDGIFLKPSEHNKYIYYYGEPVILSFEIFNSTNSTKKYYFPYSMGQKILVFLKNNASGELLQPFDQPWLIDHNKGLLGSARRENMPIPDDDRSFKPEQWDLFQFNMSNYYGNHYLIDSALLSKARSNSHYYNYLRKALVPGEYEAIVQIDLLPSDAKLVARYCFKVVPVPDTEVESFKEFLKSIYYTHKYHRDGLTGYDENHPLSLENFVKKYPNSQYASYAIYFRCLYGTSFIGNTYGQGHKDFIDYFPKVKDESLKMVWAANMSSTLTSYFHHYRLQKEDSLYKEKSTQAIDKMLQTLKDDYYTSKIIIAKSTFLKNNGLVNYAKPKEKDVQK